MQERIQVCVKAVGLGEGGGPGVRPGGLVRAGRPDNPGYVNAERRVFYPDGDAGRGTSSEAEVHPGPV